MYTSMNRFGPNRPLCTSNRQFVTMGIINRQPEEMKLKPEYLGNEHFKFLNDFGLQQQFITDKKFVDINNSVNRHSPHSHMALNSSFIMHTVPSPMMVNCTANYHTSARHNHHKGGNDRSCISNSFGIETTPHFTNKPEEKDEVDHMGPNKPAKLCESRKSPPRDCEESQGCSINKLPRKSKKNPKPQCDKMNNKSSKKSKRQRNYRKQSKRESDRNVIGNSSQKRKGGKLWHKESLEREFMDVDDVSCYSNSDNMLESPIITTVCSSGSMPTLRAIYVEPLSSPIKTESKIQCNKNCPTVYDLKEYPDICMGNSPKQNNFRPRLPSECESEDSFIVFEECSKVIDLDDDESTDFDTSSGEDSDDDDDDDVMDFCAITMANNDRATSASPTKKVRFAPGKDLCEVHPMIQWSFAYQKARKGPWEQFAVDRMRFRNRISDVEPILNGVLQPEHRDAIYRKRFLQDN